MTSIPTNHHVYRRLKYGGFFDTAPVIFVVKLGYNPFNNVIVVVVVVVVVGVVAVKKV